MQRYPLMLLVTLASVLTFTGTLPTLGVETPNFPDDQEMQVVGGVDAEINDYPWMGALVWTSSETNTRQFCGCTAISPYWLMTAGHCVDDSVTPESFKVVFGTADLENTDSAQVFYPKTIVIHPDYVKSYTKDNDIALIQLRDPLPDSIAKVQLATDRDLDLEGTTVRILGWGLTNTDYGKPEDTLILKEGDLVVVSKEFANLPEYFNGRIHDNVIAAGSFDPYVSSGNGDSGGPLLSFNQQLDRWEQIGISSFSAGCDKPVNPLSIFTQVSAHQDWINQILDNDFLSWAKSYNLPNLIFDEGDSYRPLMEYILGLDPTVVDPPITSELFMDSSNPDLPTFGRLRIRSTVPPINIRREWSRDLDDWNTADIDRDRITMENIPNTHAIYYNIPVSGKNSAQGFYRIGHEDNRGILHGPYSLRVGSSATGLFNMGTVAYGLTHYDYLLDTLGSLNPIRVSAESDIHQPFTLRVVELETGKQIFGWSESGRPDSPNSPFADIFTPEAGKKYLIRVSSLDWTIPQFFRLRTELLPPETQLVPANPIIGNLDENDVSHKRENHFADFYTSRLEANTNYKIEVRTEKLDAILWIKDASTSELLQEVDQEPEGDTEAILFRFEDETEIQITVASWIQEDTGEYVLEVGGFSEWTSIKPGEKTIGFINSGDRTSILNDSLYYIEEINLSNLDIPEGNTVRVTGFGGYIPTFGIYNLTANEYVHTGSARCEDKDYYFNAMPGNSYRLVILATESRLGNNYKVELFTGEPPISKDSTSDQSKPTAQQTPDLNFQDEVSLFQNLYQKETEDSSDKQSRKADKRFLIGL